MILYTTLGALKLAANQQTALADAEIHLFQVSELPIDPSTILADLEAEEADFTGYAEAVISAWIGPMLAPVSGAAIQTPTVVFEIDSPFTVPNTIQGWWLEDADGDLIAIGTFPEAVPMEGPGNFITFSVRLVEGANG